MDELLDDADADRFISVLAARVESKKTTQQSASTSTADARVGGSLGPTGPELDASLGHSSSVSAQEADERAFVDVLLRVFDMKEYVLRLKALLDQVGIRHLFVFVDDFSELPADAMQLVVDTLLAPLNNWSDELVKFKVAGIPAASTTAASTRPRSTK